MCCSFCFGLFFCLLLVLLCLLLVSGFAFLSVSAFSLSLFFFPPWSGRLGAVAAWCRDSPPASTGRRSFYACLARVPHATYGAGWEVGRGWLLACSLCNTLRNNRVLINVLSSRVCRGQSPHLPAYAPPFAWWPWHVYICDLVPRTSDTPATEVTAVGECRGL